MLPDLIKDIVARGIHVSLGTLPGSLHSSGMQFGYAVSGFTRRHLLVPTGAALVLVEFDLYIGEGASAYRAEKIVDIEDLATRYVAEWKDDQANGHVYPLSPSWLPVLKAFDLVKTAPVQYIPK